MTNHPSSKLWFGPTLVLDSSTTHTQIGLLKEGHWLAYTEREGEALETIFHSLDELLRKTQHRLSDLSNVAIGAGPGSILGLRLSLIALETWRKLPELQHWSCYEFHGLSLQAQLLSIRKRVDFHLISDFRGKSWHHLSVTNGSISTLEIIHNEDIQRLEGDIHYSPTGRGRQALPEVTYETTPFSLSELPELFPFEWAKPVKTPELYLPSPPVFKKWDAQPHQGHA